MFYFKTVYNSLDCHGRRNWNVQLFVYAFTTASLSVRLQNCGVSLVETSYSLFLEDTAR